MLADEPRKKKVVLCVPTLTRPFDQCVESIKASIPLIVAAGWDEGLIIEVGCPYISAARAKMLRKALDAKADVIVFIDHDLSWDPENLLQLIEAEGDLVAGTYRYKKEPEEYMGALIPAADGTPTVRADGAVLAYSVPAGFLKITKSGVNRFIEKYPHLCYGERHAPHIDLFNHGAHEHTWYGEDMAMSRNWREKCGSIWLLPNLNLTHHTADAAFPGNFHEYMLRQEGGSNDPNRKS